MNPYQGQYWRDVDPNSTMTKMEHHYWITKQSVFKKIGKKEDECIVSSDAELDAKLELFRSIQESCLDLQKIIDRYQERICYLAQEENAMGRFLKEAGKVDKSGAGKVMTNVGKSLSYSGQQRLALRGPLVRLYQEVETFRQQAISDTLSNLKAMEKHRMEYRAALSWMKDVSQELDPEKHLDKFRKVQSQVRRSKAKFDQLKLDCLQKVDLLAASRCNMFSHALVLYHNGLVQYSEKASNTYHAVANTFKGFQPYDFCVIKELAEPSQKLAEQLVGGTEEACQDSESQKQDDKDILLFFESEFHDEEEKTKQNSTENATKDLNVEQLLDIGDKMIPEEDFEDIGNIKLLGDIFTDRSQVADNLNKEWDEVFGKKEGHELSKEWEDVFGEKQTKGGAPGEYMFNENACLPSQLLSQLHLGGNKSLLDDLEPSPSKVQHMEIPNQQGISSKQAAATKAKDMSTWLNLFADLDPLADPDAVGTKSHHDRNC